MEKLKEFVTDEEGFTGAEKALITLMGLGLILLVVKVIKVGSEKGASQASATLSGQNPGSAPPFEPGGK